MNVSNRQKTTDAETPATQTSQHHHQQLLAYISCRQAATVPNKSSRSRQEEEQEQLVTSTSADSLLPLQAEGEGEEISIELETVVSSPAHITSSTHSYGIVTDSHEEEVMPSTSENARLEKDEYPIKQIHQNTNNYNHLTNTTIKEMVARDINTKTVTDVAGRGSSSLGEVGVQLQDLDNQSTSSSNKIIDSHSEKNKIILKLPKLSGCESQLISTNEDDLRKVEPLKINLHNTHHHHTANVNHTPKITIKPILEEQATDVLVSSEECSSSAEDDVISKLNNSEPHILPKLTIRAKNEDYGSSQTTVVPKLTIKINDSSATETLGTSSAANTPPLPKLTIKTGQDGQTESIITNVSPASSTTSSSSSLASSSSASLSSANFLVATSLSSASIPKLTIRPIQKSHEFKTTESNDQQPSIPKLCIKTNMLCTDVTEECTLSKIPKLTIKTGQEHAVIITQHTDNVKTTGIPKLTIKTKSLDMPDEFNISASTTVEKIPKLTIKTNNSNEVTKICRNKVQSEAVNASIDTPLTSPKHQAVPKLTISKQLSQLDKSVDILDEDVTQCCLSKRNVKSQKVSESISLSERPYSTEESGISDDPEDEDEEQVYETNKIVPKLTIKNLGSPQQKLKVVVDSDVEVKKHINSTPLSEDVDEFSDLLNVDNVCGESSNSQEFCGFNENITDCSINVQDVSIKGVSMNTEGVPEQHQTDDMDLDETLKSQHEPQMFQNLVDYNIQASSSSSTQQAGSNGNVAVIGHIIDTVDLTSSAGSSPSHRFDYNDDEDVEKRPTDPPNVANNAASAKTNILLGCLQREMTVIKNTQQLKLHIENNSVPPPLQPKPNVINKSPVSLKYPQLAERLMTNGSTVENMIISAQTANNNSGENIIDSIEILDTPEGSPRNSLDGRPENVEDISIMPNGLQDSKEAHTTPLNNNNNLNLKRHATLECKDMEGKKLTSKTIIEELPSKLRKLQKEDMCATQHNNELHQKQILNNLTDEVKTKSEMIFLNKTSLQSPIPQHQRSRKQKHENLLPIPIDEVADSIQKSSSEGIENHIEHISDRNENTTPIVKKRGRPKKSETILQSSTAKDEATPANTENRQDYKSRRVQLLRKRLAIDMVDAEQPVTKISDVVLPVESNDNNNDIDNIDTPKRDRSLRTPLRTSRRSNTPILFQTDSKTMKNKPLFSLPSENKKVPGAGAENDFNHFIESNSSISSASSSTVTSTVASMSNNVCISVVSQIDLTMSSSSSNSNSSTTNTITTVEATTRNDSVMIGNSDGSINCGIVGGNSNNSMLPPTTILSSSDPLPDVIFRPNDFSSIIATQQLREHFITEHKAGLRESQDEEIQGDVSGADNSEGVWNIHYIVNNLKYVYIYKVVLIYCLCR